MLGVGQNLPRHAGRGRECEVEQEEREERDCAVAVDFVDFVGCKMMMRQEIYSVRRQMKRCECKPSDIRWEGGREGGRGGKKRWGFGAAAFHLLCKILEMLHKTLYIKHSNAMKYPRYLMVYVRFPKCFVCDVALFVY